MRILTNIVLFVLVVILGLILSANVIDLVDYFSDSSPHMIFGATGMLMFPQYCIACVTLKMLSETPKDHQYLYFQMLRIISIASLIPLCLFLLLGVGFIIGQLLNNRTFFVR